MKVKIEIAPEVDEPEVIVRCSSLTEEVVALQKYLADQGGHRCLSLKHGDTDYFIPLTEIYFFETEGRAIHAHTADRIFDAPYKLYELEEFLPGAFMRISKSTIANLDHIYSITRNLTASSVMEFAGSKKTAAVSRGYYKAVSERLAQRRLGKTLSERNGKG